MTPPGSSFVLNRGSVIEHDAYVTFGLKELRVDDNELRVTTKMGGDYRLTKDQVSHVVFGRRKGAVGKWFAFRLADGGTAPVQIAVFCRQSVLAAFENHGWSVEAK